MAEECRRQAWMYPPKQFNGWVQNHKRGAIWVDDQVECAFRSSLIRVVNQSVAESEIEVKPSVNCNPSMLAEPPLKSQGQVLGRISSACLPVLHDRDVGLHQDFSQGEEFAVVPRETLFSRNPLQGGQYNFTWWGHQQVGGRTPPGGERRFPPRQREHCSTALANRAEDSCNS